MYIVKTQKKYNKIQLLCRAMYRIYRNLKRKRVELTYFITMFIMFYLFIVAIMFLISYNLSCRGF